MRDPFTKTPNFSDLVRDGEAIKQERKFIRQLMEMEFIMPGGIKKRIQRSPGSDNAYVDLTDGSSAIPTVAPSGWGGSCSLETSAGIADATFGAIQAASFKSKIVALWPFLGCDIATLCIPLIDAKGVGPATNVGFIDADFDQFTGLQGDGGKYLNSHLRPSHLGVAGAGGLGWWEAGFVNSSNPEPIGCYKESTIPDNRFSIDLRSANKRFNWGTSGGGGGVIEIAASATNAHYYGQSASTSERSFFENGVLLGAANTSTSFSGNSDNEIILCGCDTGFAGIKPWPGRGECAYFTDGTLTNAEVIQFHALLLKYLIGPKRAGVVVPFVNVGGGGTIPNPDHPDNAEDSDCEAFLKRIVVAQGAVVTAQNEVVIGPER